MTLHLTHEQLCDIVLADSSLPHEGTSAVVQEHLLACLLCAAELESLRASLLLFRDASTSYASQQFAESYMHRQSIAPPQRYLAQPLYWAAAMTILVAAIFPLSLHRQHPPTATIAVVHNAESDEALLDDIDQKLSADVPSPMEPLADPTASATTTESNSPQRNN